MHSDASTGVARPSCDPQPDVRVAIELGDRGYDIVVGDGLLNRPQAWPAACKGHTAVIVSNPTVRALHGSALEAALATRHERVLQVTVPEGEAHKDWPAIDTIVTTLLQHACDRKTVLYALGGGVVGDMTGFAAACYMRGVPYVQVPTTLLAQVDSSVGGKTAINHALGKNMIGAFHQPVAVLCDLATLDTLPDREYRSGLAEVLKYGPIADAEFLAWLEDHIDDLVARKRDALTRAVRRSCEIKAAVVGADEREAGLRAILNFGHTFGHAIEGATGYGAWLHGEAVACGMVLATELSAELDLVPKAVVTRLRALIERAGLPTRAPELPWSTWMQWMRVDKKAEAGDIQYVLLDAVGHAVLKRAPEALVQRVVATHSAQV